MIRIRQCRYPVSEKKPDFKKLAAKILKISADEILSVTLHKESVDARKRQQICFVYELDVKVRQEEPVLRRCKNPDVGRVEETPYRFPGRGSSAGRPVIVGMGPAGLFCAYELAIHGFAPLLLEQGEPVEDRTRTVERFWQGGDLDRFSNVQFGEGGAGAFSDGKLTTLIKDPFGRGREVLKTFVRFGAEEEILYQNRPHLGTDRLKEILPAMRRAIRAAGGEIRFRTRMEELLLEPGRQKLAGIRVRDISNGVPEEIACRHLVLAIGHSARDTFYTLEEQGVPLSAKSFAVGLRIQHTQAFIDERQYGFAKKFLPAADYKLTATAKDGRGVYSFCMCPGGYVVNASSELKRLAVNGMSYRSRDGINANSALIVAVTPQDFPEKGPLAGLAFQRRLEEAAYLAGNGKIPLQRFGDFAAGRPTSLFGDVKPAVKGLFCPANVRAALPDFIARAFLEAMEMFDRKLPGFADDDALLAAVESRTSSPVRIERDANLESPIRGLFPCGEGAGYAGGIMSAAVDGIRIAEELAARLNGPARKEER
ncbi:MAG: FAD-dependent oxidoreductase [Lachnospiraceae bacterium]|nr:FAD-dependent oxidoreductase [Lachnospiraceae bacterium]